MKKQTRQDNVFSLERYFVDIQTMIGEQWIQRLQSRLKL
jgi:hypothetical protein